MFKVIKDKVSKQSDCTLCFCDLIKKPGGHFQEEVNLLYALRCIICI